MSKVSHWREIAGRFDLLGSPLRPSREDVATAEEILRLRSTRGARALLLGVTPELATMRWPDETSLTAVDKSAAMIQSVFPKTGLPTAEGAKITRAIEGEWTALPLASSSCDVVVGDGCLTTFPFPDGYVALAEELRRVLAPGGMMIMRVFAAPQIVERLDAVVEDLQRGHITSFHAMKWRLAMALYREPGVPVSEIFNVFHNLVPDPERLFTDEGPFASVDPRVLETIEVYRDASAPYSFPTVEAIEVAWRPFFRLVERHPHTYELGERCPTLVFERVPG